MSRQCPHARGRVEVLLERQIDDFSHKDAGDAIAAAAARFPDSDVSVDSDLDASS